jgi:hypothetical protein
MLLGFLVVLRLKEENKVVSVYLYTFIPLSPFACLPVPPVYPLGHPEELALLPQFVTEEPSKPLTSNSSSF